VTKPQATPGVTVTRTPLDPRHKEVLAELRRLERAWNLIEGLSLASKHYIRDRLLDELSRVDAGMRA